MFLGFKIFSTIEFYPVTTVVIPSGGSCGVSQLKTIFIIKYPLESGTDGFFDVYKNFNFADKEGIY